MKRIKVAQFGLGPIGVESLRFAAQQPWLEVVGAVDNDPAKVGRPLTEITGLGQLDGLRVARDLDALFREAPPEVILHTASSSAAATLAQMRPALEFGVSVATTCEQMIFPALKEPALVKEFDALCRHTGARVVAAGVNPGFVMDVLPIALTGVSRSVESIFVERVVDAATRRAPLQAKIGSGQEPEEFSDKLRAGRAGHAGLIESAALVAHAMGWPLDSLVEEGEPVLAGREIATPFFTVPTGKVCGIRQRVVGTSGDVERVVLDIAMFLGAPEPHDRIVVRGRPPLDVTIRNGIAGDDATVAALINVVPRLLAAAPGLRLATDLSLPKWSGNS
ncbi:MAG: dihydrodipicolinate reductase [Opitutae bacterium]|nr:dihydrodipicolinate reductase [Opitutae bacterium]